VATWPNEGNVFLVEITYEVYIWMLKLDVATGLQRKTLEKYIRANAQARNSTEPVKKGRGEEGREKLIFQKNEIIFSRFSVTTDNLRHN